MLARLSYLLVILIWATTPLAIKLGGDSLPPMTGLTLRITAAFMVGCTICTIGGYANLRIKQNWKLYCAASIAVFPNMALVYFSAQYIPSGLIALLFGLSPFFTAVLAYPILGENLLDLKKMFAIFLACSGLAAIMFDEEIFLSSNLIGIGLMLISNVMFSVSALLVKKLSATTQATPLEQALGSMAFALPGLYISWALISGITTPQLSSVSLASLLYLSLFGSLVGFVAYYHILNHLTVETVSLIPLMTPVLAMILGAQIAEENISIAMLIGAGMILVGLGIHQGNWHALRRIVRRVKL